MISEQQSQDPVSSPNSWISRTVLAIVFATFFSDFSHEMCTAVLPMYLGAIGLGPAALGLVEGVADFLVSMSKLSGGIVGHVVQRKRPLVALGYLVTTLGTAGIGLVSRLPAVLGLRTAAWIGRGFRSPLRDALLAESVDAAYFGRAYGLERAGDMLGAVAGPLVATLLLWLGVPFRTIILWTLLPGLAAAAAIYFFTRDRETNEPPVSKLNEPTVADRTPFPRIFWVFLVGVTLFGMGDFSRTFLIWLASRVLGEDNGSAGGALSLATLLYAMHNLVSAAVAYPIGHLGDRRAKLPLLTCGYGLGVVANLLLAFVSGSVTGLVAVMVLSGIYVAMEETLEKAIAAEFLPLRKRSLGFGILACANAGGDMISSVFVGYFLQRGNMMAAFGIASAVGALGFLWMLQMLAVRSRQV